MEYLIPISKSIFIFFNDEAISTTDLEINPGFKEFSLSSPRRGSSPEPCESLDLRLPTCGNVREKLLLLVSHLSVEIRYSSTSTQESGRPEATVKPVNHGKARCGLIPTA